MTDFWTLERIFRNAWPALDEIEHDGWLARLTGGDTRRPNAINPLSPQAGDALAALKHFRPLYDQAGLRPIVRVPDFCSEADRPLAGIGLVSEGRTRTIAAALAGRTMPDDPGLRITAAPSRAWITARVGADGDPATEALLARLRLPAAFVTVERDGSVAALGYVVFDEGYAIVESIRTMPAFQRQGLGTLCMDALLAAALAAGAHTACLQVDSANVAGRALYAGLGFDRHLYDYHYRVPA